MGETADDNRQDPAQLKTSEGQSARIATAKKLDVRGLRLRGAVVERVGMGEGWGGGGGGTS